MGILEILLISALLLVTIALIFSLAFIFKFINEKIVDRNSDDKQD